MIATVNLAYAQHSNSTMPATRGTSSMNCGRGTPHLELSTNFCSFTRLMGLHVRFTRTLAGLHMSVLASRSSSQNCVGCPPVPTSPRGSTLFAQAAFLRQPISVCSLLSLYVFYWTVPFQLFFSKVLWRYNWYTNNWTYVMCTIWWLWTPENICDTLITIKVIVISNTAQSFLASLRCLFCFVLW